MQTPPNPMRFQADSLKEQARCVQQEYPQLFDYLVRRDEATRELFKEVMHYIPHPDDLPVISLPFIDSMIELMRPQEQCPVCKDQNAFWLLNRKQRAKLCQVCRHGVYLKRSGIEALVG